ncbi:MAG: general stress protein 26 [Hyphomicrobiaceae bacterium]|jgi:general stress protein 26
MSLESFEDLAAEFEERVRRIVWATVTTVDAQDRPRSRILHPIWEGSIGWIATGRNSPKASHIAQNPYVSITYWDQAHEQIHAECLAEWVDDPGEKSRIWDLFGSTEPPLGYDLAGFFQSKDNPEYGLLRLTPWRLELWSLADLAAGKASRVCRG